MWLMSVKWSVPDCFFFKTGVKLDESFILGLLHHLIASLICVCVSVCVCDHFFVLASWSVAEGPCWNVSADYAEMKRTQGKGS